VINYDNFVPAIETPEHIEAARRAYLGSQHNATILEPILTGEYSNLILDRLGADAPDIQEGDMQIIGQPLDCLGFNVYTGSYVRAADNPEGYQVLPFPEQYPEIGVRWLKFLPESAYWGVRMIADAFHRPELPILITENGCPSTDQVTPEGEVFDLARITVARSYLRNAHRAVMEGYPLKGYFHWSLLDNFEWGDGYSTRFGLVHTDYATQRRIPKLAYHWYRQVIRERRVL
jgi:beta-glucosidase